MSRLLLICSLLSLCVGCGWEIRRVNTAEKEAVTSPVAAPDATKPTDVSYSVMSESDLIRDMDVLVEGKTYSSTLKGEVMKENGGRRLTWTDAQGNRHQLTSDDVIKHTIYVQERGQPKAKDKTPEPSRS